MEYFLIGPMVSFGMFVYLMILINEQVGETPEYSLWKVIVDAVGVIVLGVLAIPFIYATICSVKGRTPPVWIQQYVSFVIGAFAKFFKGKEYA